MKLNSFVITVKDFLLVNQEVESKFNFFKLQYVIPKYQREYKWNKEKIKISQFHQHFLSILPCPRLTKSLPSFYTDRSIGAPEGAGFLKFWTSDSFRQSFQRPSCIILSEIGYSASEQKAACQYSQRRV